MAKHYTLSVYNLSGERLCTLYDSDVEQDGTAYDIEISKELNGWKEVSFSLPKQLNNGEKNYRIDFIRNEHLLYLYEDDERDVYCIKEPAHIHDSKSLVVNVQANHLSEELKSKNLYRSFTDENGVDTCDNLIRKAIAGTGWTLGTYDTFYENTGETEKVRSYTCSEKTGAYAMITGICALFEAHPVFHGRTRTIDIRANDNSTGYMEINFGKNMNKISRTLDSSNLITRLYVEGEYSDVGYVGIETVNPTGLPFILNFDYYKELGVFTPEHQAAVDAYIAAYQRITASINTNTTEWIEKSGTLIGHIGNAGYVYCPIISGVIQTNSKIYSSDIPESERTYNDGDDVCLFRADGSYDHYEYSSRTWGGYTAIVKFYPVLTGTMAVREDNITVNSNYVTTTLASLNTYLTNGGYPTVTVASLKTTYNTQDLRQVKNDDFPVSSLPEQYQDSNVRSYVSDIGRGDYQVTTTTADLITEGAEVISLIQQVHTLKNTVSSGEQELNDAEAAFNLAMGVLLKDGYWSNNNYVPGQEQELYNDALVMSRKIGYPVVSYTVSVKDLSIKPEYADERMEIGYEVRMYDDVMGINDYAFVNQTKDHPDNPAANSLVIKTDLEDIGSKSFSSIIERITDLADQLKDEQDIYKRARIIDDDGKIDTSFLEGAINILTQKLSSASSNWETDANGNIIFTSLDGNGAMQLCGYGFMIASEKNPDGSWRWRTFGTGEGFTADLITAGFIQADRIAAHSITVNHLASDVGSSLDLSSNVAITSTVQDLNDLSGTVSQLSQTTNEISARVGNMRIGAENLVWTGDAHLSYPEFNEIIRSGFTPTTYTRGGVIFRLNPPTGGFTPSNWSVINLKDILMSGTTTTPEKLTLSFYTWSHNIVGAQPKLSLLMYRPASTGVESVTQAVVSNLEVPANAPGARREYSFELPYSGSFYLQLLLHGNANTFTAGSVYVSDIMLERGTMATDYGMNPEETNDRLKYAEIKITDDSIVQTVVNGINSSTSTQLADAIINKVTGSEQYEEDLGNKVNVSTFTQEMNQITARVTSIEGEITGINLAAISQQVFGGSSGGDISGDNVLNNNTQYWYSMSQKVFRMSGAYTGDYNILAFNNIYVRAGIEYVLSYWSRADSVTGGYPKLRIDLYNSDNQQYIDNGGYQYLSTDTTYRKYTYKFTAGYTGTFSLRFLFLSTNRNGWSGGYINFSDVMFEEGTISSSWTPNPYDIDARISSAEVKITPEAITQTVTSSQAYQTDMSTITQRANEIELKVDNMAIGGDNLVRMADGTVSVGTGTIATGFANDNYYRLCGKEYRMYPFTDSYNYVQFLSAIPMRSNAPYTLSFYAWAYNISSPPSLTVQVLGTDTSSSSISIARTASITNAPQKFVYTFTPTQTANSSGMRILFSINSSFSGSSAWVTVTDVKFEQGNKATTWSPHREEMRAGSTVVINKDEVAISTPEFSIDIGSNGQRTVKITQDEVNISTPTFVVDIGSDENPDLLLDDTGATFRAVSSPNVAEAYTGDGYTYDAATNTVSISVPSQGSLQTIFGELSGKMLNMNVTITLTSNDTSNGAITLRGVYGSGQITIKGPVSGTSTGGRVVTKPIVISSAGVQVVFEDLTFNYQSGNIANLTNDSFVRFTRCVFNAGSGTSILVVLNNGTKATLYQCQLLSPSNSNPTGATLMQANYNTDLLIYSCKGGTNRYFLSGNGGNIKIYGTRPAGSYTYLAPSLTAPADPNSVTVDSTGFSGGTPVPAPDPDPTTATYSLASKGSYGGGSWNSNYLRDGILNGIRYVGSMWFNISALNGKTIKSASLTLTRNSAGADSANVRLKTTNQTAGNHSGSPDEQIHLITDYGKIGSVRRGKTATIDIPASAITDIVASSNANCKALTIYVNDTEQMSGKSYSSNYASFDDATLTVTYIP